MVNCQYCGRPVSGNVCQNCGQPVSQIPPPNMPPPNIQQYPAVDYSKIAISLLFIGAIVLSCGVFSLAFVPDEVQAGDFQAGSNSVSMELEISGYKIGVILLGIGVLIEGIGSALVAREHLRRLDNVRGGRV